VSHQLSLPGLQDLTNNCFNSILPAAAAAAAVLPRRSLCVARLRLQMIIEYHSSDAGG
jgi:hypothetical protein